MEKGFTVPAFTDNQPTSTGLMSSQPPAEPSAQPSAVEPPKPSAATKNYKVNPVGDNSASNNSVPNNSSDKRLVSSQMNGLLNENSEYMRIAKRQATEAANERGMLNSSMAIGNAHEAAIKSAMPIAQQDAATHFQTQQAQEGFAHDINKQAIANQHTLGQLAAQNDYKLNQDKIASELRISETSKVSDIQTAEKLQLLEAQGAVDIKKQAASLDANYRNGYLQSATGIVTNAQQQISSIFANTSITAAQQKAAVAKIQTDMNKNLEWLTKSADALKEWPIKTDSFAKVADDLKPPEEAAPAPSINPYYPYR